MNRQPIVIASPADIKLFLERLPANINTLGELIDLIEKVSLARKNTFIEKLEERLSYVSELREKILLEELEKWDKQRTALKQVSDHRSNCNFIDDKQYLTNEGLNEIINWLIDNFNIYGEDNNEYWEAKEGKLYNPEAKIAESIRIAQDCVKYIIERRYVALIHAPLKWRLKPNKPTSKESQQEAVEPINLPEDQKKYLHKVLLNKYLHSDTTYEQWCRVLAGDSSNPILWVDFYQGQSVRVLTIGRLCKIQVKRIKNSPHI